MSRGATYEVFGERLTAREIALVAGTSMTTMCARLASGMPPERAIAQPVREAEDIVGKSFGYDQIVVLREVERSKHGKRQYLYQCACGSPPKVAVGGDLKSGRVVSCGCVFKRKASERALDRAEDLTGREFADGNVVVVGPRDLAAEKAAGFRARRWDCICRRCGTTFPSTASNLRAGFVTSCGCRKTKKVDVFGQRMTMRELSDISGVDVPTIAYRMRARGMSAEDAALTSKMRTQPTIPAVVYGAPGVMRAPSGREPHPFGEGGWVY